MRRIPAKRIVRYALQKVTNSTTHVTWLCSFLFFAESNRKHSVGEVPHVASVPPSADAPQPPNPPQPPTPQPPPPYRRRGAVGRPGGGGNARPRGPPPRRRHPHPRRGAFTDVVFLSTWAVVAALGKLSARGVGGWKGKGNNLGGGGTSDGLLRSRNSTALLIVFNGGQRGAPPPRGRLSAMKWSSPRPAAASPAGAP